MGNSLSNNSSINNVYEPNNIQLIEDTQQTLIEAVDQIATGYILKQNMIDIMRFTDKEYRQNLILLTSHILKSKLSSVDLGILKERVLEGSPTYYNNTNNNLNNNANNNSNKTNKTNKTNMDIDDKSYENRNKYNDNMDDNLVYISNKEQMLKYSIETEREKKKAIVTISKFYVKIMTLFAAIVSVIDPQYVYETEDGEKKYFYLKDYDSIKMMGQSNKTLRLFSLDNPMNLVKRRLSILKNKMDTTNNGETSENMVVINPGEKICKMNLSEENMTKTSLTSEIGIKELDMLYYDVFDEETNSWSKRSEEMDEIYRKDVLTFFQIFSGKKDKPENIKTFEDIELLDFHNLKRCRNGDFFEDLLVSKNDVLFRKYLTKIEEIQEITKTQKRKLLFILKSIFHERPNGDGEEQFKINPELKMKQLEEKQSQIKECILKIYTLCEQKFIEALIIYERMYDNQHGAVVENRLNDVNKNWSNNSNSIEGLKQMELNKQDLGNMKDNENSQTVLNNKLLQENRIPIHPTTIAPIIKDTSSFETNKNSFENKSNSLEQENTISLDQMNSSPENSLYGEEASVTQGFGTQVPTTQVPTTQVPTTQVPTAQVPTAQVPTTQVPTTQVPTAQVPTAQMFDSQVTSPQQPISMMSGVSEETPISPILTPRALSPETLRTPPLTPETPISPPLTPGSMTPPNYIQEVNNENRFDKLPQEQSLQQERPEEPRSQPQPPIQAETQVQQQTQPIPNRNLLISERLSTLKSNM